MVYSRHLIIKDKMRKILSLALARARMNMKQSSLALHYYILILAALIFFIYSVWEIYPVNVTLSNFLGLISLLPISYWIGLCLIAICSVFAYLDDECKSGVFIGILIVLGLYVIGVGTLTEQYPRFWDTYIQAGETKEILASGHIDIISSKPLNMYNLWPIYHILNVVLVNVFGIGLLLAIKLFFMIWISRL